MQAARKRPVQAVLMALLLALFGMLATPVASAHEMSMAEIDLRELTKGEFLLIWGASGKNRPISDDLTPVWPAQCQFAEERLQCGAEGLSGTLTVQGVGKAYSAALVRVHWIDGQTRTYTLTAAQPGVQLFGQADDGRGAGEILYAYTVLGIEHILGGIDHLLFVIGLLFLVGFQRRLILTITAFTLAHSLTLASSALGWLTLRSPPVEASIALSIVLVAAEALHRRDTLARRFPSLVAFGFGLIHGLGFAGALKDIGLPENHLPLALLTFNIGVEIGQLMTIALAYVLYRLFSQQRWFAAGRKPVLYAIGITAAYWSWLRIATMLA